jgi:hypothetical protein
MEPGLSRAQWRKASYSGNSGNCVDVAESRTAMAVRDSKKPEGPVLVVTDDDWRTFLRSIRASA